MQRFLEEIDFRWNRRKMSDLERLAEAVAGTEGTRLYYKAPAFLEGVQKPAGVDTLVRRAPEESEDGEFFVAL
jgi:hypothetical protein